MLTFFARVIIVLTVRYSPFVSCEGGGADPTYPFIVPIIFLGLLVWQSCQPPHPDFQSYTEDNYTFISVLKTFLEEPSNTLVVWLRELFTWV
jgi:hypothetical protein